jgi:tetratricopeptide (TPR) repeat protein
MSDTLLPNHEWFRARLDPYAVGLLDEAEERLFLEHARSCASCAEALRLHGESALVGGPESHIPTHLIARWDRAARRLQGLSRRIVRQHLEQCTACRQDLEALGFAPSLEGEAVEAAAEPAEFARTREWEPEEEAPPVLPFEPARRSTSRGGRQRTRLLLGAAAAAVTVTLALAVWKLGPALFAGHPREKSWILVADFAGPAQDSQVAAATRDLVVAGLEESEIVAAVPQLQILTALHLAGKPATTRLDGAVARELAYRSAVRTVLEGSIGRLGKGYTLVLRLSDVDSARVTLTVSDAAKDEDDLIPTVSRIARRLRAELGERRNSVEATRQLVEVMTPSFEAYKLYLQAFRLHDTGEFRAALPLLRAAIDLDPDFASAWQTYGITLNNLGEQDSAFAAYRQALARPGRLSGMTRRVLEAALSDSVQSTPALLACADRIVLFDPGLPAAYEYRCIDYADGGRWAEALEGWRKAAMLSPFGPSQINLINQFYTLLLLGRTTEARALLPSAAGTFSQMAPAWIAAAEGSWTRAESLATQSLRHGPTDLDLFFEPRWVVAATQALRGEVRESERTLLDVQREAESRGNAPVANSARLRRIALSLFAHGPGADPGHPGLIDHSTAGLAMRSLFAAAAGDSAGALEPLAALASRPPRLRQTVGFTPRIARAWNAARGKRWEDVLRELGPAALQGDAAWAGFQNQSAPVVRWLAGEAYEGLGRPDSAAAYFERAIAPPPQCGSEWIHGRMAYSFGHQRLALLYARMGRLSEARRHWEIFSENFTHPDPELVTLIDEARAALVNAEAMAQPRAARVSRQGERLARSPLRPGAGVGP